MTHTNPVVHHDYGTSNITHPPPSLYLTGPTNVLDPGALAQPVSFAFVYCIPNGELNHFF